jgi:hypothetical protein
MGDFLLGALLGTNQSFERFSDGPQGWLRESDQASFYPVDSFTAVHSSPVGLLAMVHSTGGVPEVLRFDHGSASDAHRVWFPEVATHALRSTVWARAGDAASSGSVRWRLGGSLDALSAPIAHASSLALSTVETQVVSAAGTPHAGLVRVSAAMAPATVYLDDVLTAVDGIVLHPEWSLEEREQLVRAEHRTQAGLLHSYVWHRHPEFQVPLRWLTTQEAALLNWWWELQVPLAFTLDSSDAAAVVLCRLVNGRQPIGRRIRPYGDRWEGSLSLAGLHDGRLAF